MPAKAYNPTPQPVVIDEAGHVLPGGETGDVDTTDERVLAAVATDRLVLTNPATQARTEAKATAALAAAAEKTEPQNTED